MDTWDPVITMFPEGRLLYRIPSKNQPPKLEWEMHKHVWKSPLWAFYDPYESSTIWALGAYASEKGSTQCNLYEMKRNVKLLRLDVVKNVRFMIDNKVPGTTGSMAAVFVTKDETGSEDIVLRYSILEHDKLFTAWICENGFDGYIADPIGMFHAETAICNVDVLKPLGQVPVTTLLMNPVRPALPF